MPGQDYPYELVGNNLIQPVGSTTFTASSPHGYAMNSVSSSAGGAYTPSIPELETVTNNCTMLVWAELSNVADYGKLICISYNDASWVYPWPSLAFGRDASLNSLMFEYADTGGSQTFVGSDTGFLNTGSDGFCMYAVTRQGDAVRFYKNGLLYGSQKTITDNPIEFRPHEVNLLQRNRKVSGEGATGTAPLFLIYNRALSDSEISAMYAFPYIWTSVNDKSPVFVGASSTEYVVSGTINTKVSSSSIIAVSHTVNGTTTGKVSGTSIINQDLVIPGNTVSKVGTSSTVTQDFTIPASITAKISGTSTVNQGFTYAASTNTKVSGTSSVNQDLVIPGNIGAVLAGESIVEVDVDTSVEFTGSISAKVDSTGTISVSHNISGGITAKFSGTSTLRQDFSIPGSIAAMAEVSSTVQVPFSINGSIGAKLVGRYISGNVPTIAKRLAVSYTTGESVYAIVKRLSDNFYLNDADGSFTASPADPFKTLSEDGVALGLYLANETRERWPDGEYLVVYYAALTTPDPSVDTLISFSEISLRSDYTVTDGFISDRIMGGILPNLYKLQKQSDQIYGDQTFVKKFEEIRVKLGELEKRIVK